MSGDSFDYYNLGMWGNMHVVGRGQRYCLASHNIQDTHTHSLTMKNYLVQMSIVPLLRNPKLALYISAQEDPQGLFVK